MVKDKMDKDLTINIPKVSVVVPVYNTEKYLRECLDCLINQTLKDLEFIIINDGSVDTSSAIIEEYTKKDNRIKQINQKNQGLSSTRNNGINIAVGEYICFVDSDDYIQKDFIENLYNAAIKYNADIAVGGIEKIYPNNKSKKLKSFKNIKLYNDTFEKLKILEIPKYNYVWDKIYKKDFLKKFNLTFPIQKVYEDINFTIEAVYFSNNIVVVPNSQYFYRVNHSSIVFNRSQKNVNDFYEARKYMYKFAEENNFILPDLRLPFDQVKTYYKMFGLIVLKKYTWRRITKYYLFGIIPIFEISKKLSGEK